MRVSACLMIVVCTTCLFVRAQDDSESAVRSKIIALEKAWNQAYKAGDVRALDSILEAAEGIVLLFGRAHSFSRASSAESFIASADFASSARLRKEMSERLWQFAQTSR